MYFNDEFNKESEATLWDFGISAEISRALQTLDMGEKQQEGMSSTRPAEANLGEFIFLFAVLILKKK